MRVNVLATGASVVYSGDTRPCESLVELAQGCSLLIHEATFDNDAVADAVDKVRLVHSLHSSGVFCLLFKVLVV